jgi:hypothetical protein
MFCNHALSILGIVHFHIFYSDIQNYSVEWFVSSLCFGILFISIPRTCCNQLVQQSNSTEFQILLLFFPSSFLSSLSFVGCLVLSRPVSIVWRLIYVASNLAVPVLWNTVGIKQQWSPADQLPAYCRLSPMVGFLPLRLAMVLIYSRNPQCFWLFST